MLKTTPAPSAQQAGPLFPVSGSSAVPAEAPVWSAETQALLAALRPVERAFAEHYAAGASAAAAYRRARGRSAGDRRPADRQAAYKLKSRPRVRAAVRAMLADSSIGPRINRAWLLETLRQVIEESRRCHTPAAARVIIGAIETMGRIQGELGPRRRLVRPPAAAETANSARIRAQINSIIAEARRGTISASTGPPTPPPPPRPSRPDHPPPFR